MALLNVNGRSIVGRRVRLRSVEVERCRLLSDNARAGLGGADDVGSSQDARPWPERGCEGVHNSAALMTTSEVPLCPQNRAACSGIPRRLDRNFVAIGW